MTIWYAFCDLLPFEFFHWDFIKNAFLTVLLISPLFGLTSTMVVTGKMSFFSDALGHSAFTGIAIGCLCGLGEPTWAAIAFAVLLALLFSIIRSRSNHTADTLIGVLSSTAVALGIFVVTMGGGSFTKYNSYLIGDILSVTPAEICALFVVLLFTCLFWLLVSNQLILSAVYPQLASSRRISVNLMQTLFSVVVAIIVTLSISRIGLLVLNSLMVLPAASSRNISRNLKQYHFFSILFAVVAGITGIIASYYLGTSAGATISLVLAIIFLLSFLFRKARK